MSQPVGHDMTAVLEAIDHYSNGDVDQPQEIMVELQEGCSNKHKRLNKKVYEKELAKLQTELVKMQYWVCLLYTSPSPRDKRQSRMPSSA